jgi:serine/threonine-protein kinase
MDQPSLPGFELLGKIGQGGMATVWKARQLSLDRLVAIKVLSPRLASDPADVDRFHTECKSAAMLKHPGIVQVYDATVNKGLYCLIMEYVAGESIGSRIRRKKRLTEDEVLFVIEHVAQALGHAWKTAGLIHCDIKPDNILIDADGSVKVTDLGLATTIGAMTSLAPTEEIMGTPQFMSPEQIEGGVNLDCRTDIFSLGATVYQMLTGRMLFEGASDESVLDMQLKSQAADILDVVPALSSRIAWMTEKMLARKRQDRHADWAAVTADLARLMRKGYPAPPFPAAGASVMKRSARRQKPQSAAPAATSPVAGASSRPTGDGVLRTILVIGLLAIVAGAFYMFSGSGRSSPPPPVLPAPAPAPTRLTAPVPAAPDTERRASEMFAFATNWWQKNPSRYQEAIDQFDRVVRETQGSKYSLMALDSIRSVKQAREAAIREVMAKLKAAADALGAKKQYREAALLYESYSGVLAPETKRDRLSEAQHWRDLDIQENQAMESRERAAREAFGAMLDEAAAAVIQGRLAEGLETMTAAEGREELRPVLPAIAPVTALIQKAGAMDQKIANSFTNQIDQEITIQFLTGPRNVVISKVAGNTVHGDQKVSVGEGVAAATVKIRFTADELAPREKSQRMGADSEPDVALFKGCLAAQGKGYADARAFFSRIPDEFGASLLAAIDRREAESQPNPEGATSAPAMTETAPGNARPPVPAAAEIVSGEAFRTLLMDANPGLVAWDIGFKNDDSGRLTCVSIDSRNLKNLEPFKKLAASLQELNIPQCQADNLAPLLALSRLRRLNLSDSSIVDLTPLKDLKLDALVLNNTRVKDLFPLRNMPLRELEIANTRVFVFDPLRAMPLSQLNLANSQFGELSFIKDMPLQALNLSGTKVFDFMALRRFQLKAFQCADTSFKDASLLSDMPLTNLDLANSKITDITPLRRLPLRSLRLSDTTIRDLNPIKDLKLVSLRIDNCKIKDLAPLASMPLEILTCNGSLVDDLAPLRGMQLVEFEAANTPVTELDALDGMPLKKVVISNTKVSSLKPLAQSPLKELRCEGVRSESLLTLKGMPLETLYCDFRPSQAGMGILRLFPRLKDFNGNVFLRRNQIDP